MPVKHAVHAFESLVSLVDLLRRLASGLADFRRVGILSYEKDDFLADRENFEEPGPSHVSGISTVDTTGPVVYFHLLVFFL